VASVGDEPSIPILPALAGRAEEWLAGRLPTGPLRDAATVALVRDSPDGLQVYLQRRASSMAFAAGMYVFPGGGVDPRDLDGRPRWAGPPPAWWAGQFGCDEALASALVAAAVRETFEESGVLLAGPSPQQVVADVSGADWEADRLALESHQVAFTELLERRGLTLRSDLLRPWDHWITPEMEPRRYNTRFFVAALPPGQRTRHVGGEADHVAWMTPHEAVARSRAGELGLLPPTIAVLTSLAAASTVDELLGTVRTIVPTLPRPVPDGAGGLPLVLEARPDLRGSGAGR
jgi:8-oxo-dGTP pyrophosphatase MutT (NUDIX family)